ncbi:putative Copper amine oxidase [Cladophialophora carrionii]|uniref:Amine oxidase n=1 Tax=Cladophialophora carrionii TaxID=86049 RepID=A0A1C1CY20_9EURO|nr:putative Copper amine oxidase [Cladophialophora carrionii]
MASWRSMSVSVSALVIFFVSLAYLLFSASIAAPIGQQDLAPPAASKDPHKHFQAPAENPWAELDEAEASEVYLWLHENAHLLDSNPEGASAWDTNTLNLVELLRPNKSDVADYLDHGGPPPERWARLSNLERRGDDAFVKEYMVGPLPPSNHTQILPLTYCHNSGRNSVQSPISDVFALLDWALVIGENASDITLDLLGAKTNRNDLDDPDGLVIGSRPALIDSGRMVHWLEFFRPGMKSDGRSLLPQGLYVKLDIPTARPETWRTGGWFYNGILYDNDTMLREAMKSPDFQHLVVNEDGAWTDTEDLASWASERDMAPPLSIQPYGPRYHLDRAENYISWMGFSFYLSTSQATALSLFDIRYNDSRIIYHLGLQEALAHYAGVEPMQSGLEFLDTFFGMGKMMFSLVPGLDCPGHAEYIDMSYHRAGKMYTNKNAICVFEYTSDAPLQRHTSAFSATVSRNTYLVVRSVSTVGNYDYTIDYIFYLDGSIEVKLRASGYIFGAFHAEPRSSPVPRDSSTNEYGYRIHPGVQTSMHDHVVNFRADFDICGTANTLVRTTVEPLQREYDWDKPEVPARRNTMHMVHQPVPRETGLNWPKNAAEMYLITSPTATNRWGESRAYRILPGTGMGNPAHLAILNSTTLGQSATWSSSDLWVLRNHPDTEPSSAHHNNYLEPLAPLVDFTKMVDDEDIDGEDLVVYFNLGGHHVPSSQDVPNTLMHTSASSVLFMPFNYFDEDVSKAWRQGVRVDRRPVREGGSAAAEKEEVKPKLKRTTDAPSEENKNKKQPKDEDDDNDDDDDGVTWFGGRYTQDVLVGREMLTPDLSHYMKEREEGEEGGWKAVRNAVGGGLVGLFVGKERTGEEGGPMDW